MSFKVPSDPGNSGILCFATFRTMCRQLGLESNIKGIYAMLCDPQNILLYHLVYFFQLFVLMEVVAPSTSKLPWKKILT